MTRAGWATASQDLHTRVLETCWDSMARQLAELHAPHLETEVYPVCHGCDRDAPGPGDAVWPCRTYTLIATTMLRIGDVEATLNALLP